MIFALTEHELKHPLWLKIKAALEEKLAGLRRQNDTNLDPILTATKRGEIKIVKDMLTEHEVEEDVV
jgi:hypothetical protein